MKFKVEVNIKDSVEMLMGLIRENQFTKMEIYQVQEEINKKLNSLGMKEHNLPSPWEEDPYILEYESEGSESLEEFSKRKQSEWQKNRNTK